MGGPVYAVHPLNHTIYFFLLRLLVFFGVVGLMISGLDLKLKLGSNYHLHVHFRVSVYFNCRPRPSVSVALTLTWVAGCFPALLQVGQILC
ncbi:hypothetical protein C8R47DRAFT_513993 [Mycena vitilis]|nr:hypothetical protein C8R47DRAFT_513993 [Mycena vitilis]